MPVVVHLTTTWGAARLGDLTVGEGKTVVVGRDGSLAMARWRGSRDAATCVRVSADGAEIVDGNGEALRRVAPSEVIELALIAGVRSPYRQRGDWAPEPLLLRVDVAKGAPPRGRPRSRARSLFAASAAVHLLALCVSGLVVPTLAPPLDDEPVDQGYLVGVLLCGHNAEREEPPPPEAWREEVDDMCVDAHQEELSGALSGSLRSPSTWPVASRASWLRASYPVGDHSTIESPLYGLLKSIGSLPTWGEVEPASWDASPRSAAVSPLAACFPDLGVCSFDAEPGRPELSMAEQLGVGDTPPAQSDRRRYPARMRDLQNVSALPGWAVRNALRPVVAYGERCWRHALELAPLAPRSLEVEVSVHANQVRTSVRGGSGSPVEDSLRCCLERAHDQLPRSLPTGATMRARYRVALGDVH